MKRILTLLLLAFFCPSCDRDQNDGGSPYINFDKNSLDFSRLAASESISVESNIATIDCEVSSSGWCDASLNGGTLTVSVTDNGGSGSRTAIITLEGGDVRKSLTVTQSGWSASVSDIKEDTKIAVSSATASSFQNGEGIEKSYDGSLSTIYHSHWTTTVMPVTLTYNFSGEGTMDYLMYNPRTDGTNGNFGEFDLYVATASSPEPTIYGNYNFNGSGTAGVVSFSPALQNPTQIQFVVKSGSGGFASCAEMGFFRKAVNNFDYSILFTDITCSELKPGIGKADIDNVQNLFYRELAMDLLDGNYDTEFRVQNYKAWQHPSVMAAANKTRPYSLRDNPTGIYVRRGDQLIALAGEMDGQSVSLFVQDPTKLIQGSSYPLSPGINKFNAANDGLIYVSYHTSSGAGEEVKIHIVTGRVNGYFDTAKHEAGEWSGRLAKATFEHFDLVGRLAHLTFETDAFRQYTPDGKALVDKYNELVQMEQDFMGLYKYNREFKNRMYFLVGYEGVSWMHASNYYTGYNVATQAQLLDLTKFTSDPWGPAHELGHMNQTSPGLKWRGTTEITNNIHSLYVQTRWGNRSRLLVDGVYQKAFDSIRNSGTALNSHGDFFTRLVPFWQLKLYMHDVLGKVDFYKDVYETVRVNPNPPTDGACQMEFVKIVCDVAGLDLTEFFEAWGFLTPVNIEIDDYGKGMFTVTAQMIEDCKAYIAGKNYPAPDHKVQNITDANLADFSL